MGSGRKITVGVCGGIAAYKAVELVRLLQDAGHDPHVVMTQAAQAFVTPLTFQAISGHRVITGLWGEDAGAARDEGGDSSVEHIHVAQTSHAVVVVPATADVMAKMAHGLADDFLTTMLLATEAPIIVAPAMNVKMWEHPATRANVETLSARGARIVEPGSGYLACGMTGGGRLAEPAVIAEAVEAALAEASAGTGFTQTSRNADVIRQPSYLSGLPGQPGAQRSLTGEVVLITAGGTREPIDPVRFIGNRSSGRMGYALAAEARARGANVILITAPTAIAAPHGVETMRVVSAAEMRDAVLSRLSEATVVIMAAAVSDFRVKSAAAQKMKREKARVVMLELEPTEDILAEAAKRRVPGTLVVGFAAETEDVLANARAKLARKGIDAIVANDVSAEGTGFDSDRNAGTLVTANGEIPLPEMPKTAMAGRILDEVARMLKP